MLGRFQILSLGCGIFALNVRENDWCRNLHLCRNRMTRISTKIRHVDQSRKQSDRPICDSMTKEAGSRCRIALTTTRPPPPPTRQNTHSKPCTAHRAQSAVPRSTESSGSLRKRHWPLSAARRSIGGPWRAGCLCLLTTQSSVPRYDAFFCLSSLRLPKKSLKCRKSILLALILVRWIRAPETLTLLACPRCCVEPISLKV